MKHFLQHLRDLIIPLIMIFVLPLGINVLEYQHFNRPALTPSTTQMVIGILISLAGFGLMISSMFLMIRISKSTVMPWVPPKNLVVRGPYRHLRNPMILGVIMILFGISLVFASVGIGAAATLFFLINTVYFIYSEEPKLEARFGKTYKEYKRNVPRWFPRWHPWEQEQS